MYRSRAHASMLASFSDEIDRVAYVRECAGERPPRPACALRRVHSGDVAR